ncbi:indole-3-glycerol-phosphate synthase [Candidatus Hecatella orcuttiae]|jgi:indole-3-glycerol phosphate synthase|uniref:indole-3-glycerol-phosphate synthase n=1 Tax=Candidatus Hecatella orcuttiae TaxID=1935119 RepID=UPI002867DB50|nr:indole-3-glycerol-phosphate synthase [Candidatus Hecatella orcuttiae]
MIRMEEILESVRRRVDRDYRAYQPSGGSRRPRVSLTEAIRGCSKVPVIAEVKPASPMQGPLRKIGSVEEVAGEMLQGGAVGLSVLTEPDFFGGSMENLRRVKAAFPQVPILMKDFILDERQIYHAFEAGADSVLLVASLCPRLEEFHRLVLSLGLEPLVEIHDPKDLEKTASLHPKLVGVNNRNLTTFQVDLKVTERLLPEVRVACPGAVVVSESGLRTAEDVRAVRRWGADAVLVGSAIMAAENVASKVRELVEA